MTNPHPNPLQQHPPETTMAAPPAQAQNEDLVAFQREARGHFDSFARTSGRNSVVVLTVITGQGDDMRVRNEFMPASIHGILMHAIANDLHRNPPLDLQQPINPHGVQQDLLSQLHIAVPADVIRSATYDFIVFPADLQEAWRVVAFEPPVYWDIPLRWREFRTPALAMGVLARSGNGQLGRLEGVRQRVLGTSSTAGYGRDTTPPPASASVAIAVAAAAAALPRTPLLQPRPQHQGQSAEDEQQHDDQTDDGSRSFTRRQGGRLRQLTRQVAYYATPRSRRNSAVQTEDNGQANISRRVPRAPTTPVSSGPSNARELMRRTASPERSIEPPVRQRTPLSSTSTRRSTVSGRLTRMFNSSIRSRQSEWLEVPDSPDSATELLAHRTPSSDLDGDSYDDQDFEDRVPRRRLRWLRDVFTSPAPEPTQPEFMLPDQDRSIEDMIADTTCNTAGLLPGSDWGQVHGAPDFNLHDAASSPTSLFDDLDDLVAINHDDRIDHSLPASDVPTLSRGDDFLNLRHQPRRYTIDQIDLNRVTNPLSATPDFQPQGIDPRLTQFNFPPQVARNNRTPWNPPQLGSSVQQPAMPDSGARLSPTPAPVSAPPTASVPARVNARRGGRPRGRARSSVSTSQRRATAPVAAPTAAPEPEQTITRTRSGRVVVPPRRSPTSIMNRGRPRVPAARPQAPVTTTQASQRPSTTPAASRKRSVPKRPFAPNFMNTHFGPNGITLPLAQGQPGRPPTVTLSSTPRQVEYFSSIWRPGQHVPDQMPGRAHACPLPGCRALITDKRGLQRHWVRVHGLAAADFDANQRLPVPARRLGPRSWIRVDAQGNDIPHSAIDDDDDDDDGDDDGDNPSDEEDGEDSQDGEDDEDANAEG